METSLTINDNLEIPGNELWFVASQSGGPGGQHVNKTSSKVTLFWDIKNSTALNENQTNLLFSKLSNKISKDGHMRVSVDSHRSQHQNRASAREKLALIISRALIVDKKRKPTKVSYSQKKRRLKDKKQKSETKQLRKSIEY